MRVIDYSAAFGRIRALRGELLDGKTIEETLNAKSLEGIIDILKRTCYGMGRPLPYSREGLERTIRNSIVELYTKVLDFMPKETRELLKVAIRRFEIENIKKILTSKLQDGKAISKESLMDLRGFSTVPIEKLLSAKGFNEVVEVLKNTHYGEYLKGRLPEERLETLFAVETALDYGFFRELIELNETLKDIDRKINSFYFGMQCDLLNLQWIVRAKSFFGFSEEKIFSYTIPFGAYLDNTKIRDLIRSKTLEEFLRPLSRTPWGRDMGEISDLKDPSLETKLLRRFYSGVIKSPLIKSNLFSIGSFIELLCQKEMEVHDLTVIIESKAYEIPPEAIRPLLLKVG